MTAVRWTPGMRSESGWMVYDDAHGCLDVVNVATGDLDAWTSETLPDYLAAVDMNHAGTRGEVLEQAREAWGDPELAVSRCEAQPGSERRWVVRSARQGWRVVGSGVTEEAAILDALESAP